MIPTAAIPHVESIVGVDHRWLHNGVLFPILGRCQDRPVVVRPSSCLGLWLRPLEEQRNRQEGEYEDGGPSHEPSDALT